MSDETTPREASAEMRHLVVCFEDEAGNYRSSGDHFDPAALDGCRHALLAAIARIEADNDAMRAVLARARLALAQFEALTGMNGGDQSPDGLNAMAQIRGLHDDVNALLTGGTP